MRYATAKTPTAADPLICFLDQAGYTDLPAPLRVAAERRLERGDVATLSTLDLVSQPTVVVARPPEWNDPVAVRRRGGAIARALVAEGLAAASLQLPDKLDDEAVRNLLLGFGQGAYRWDRYRSEPVPGPDRLKVVGAGRAVVAAVAEAVQAVAWCRDLINTPAEDLGPAEFVTEARRGLKGSGLKLRVIDEAEARKRGMGCLLTVGRASPRRPRLLVVEWPGRGQRPGKPLALCGKGVCFDTGGLDLKPASGMELMRKDMGGAATVLAAMKLIAAAAPRRPVRAYLPLVENSVDGNAFRPGDILRAMDGTTIENGNTDAEGRLILADAICLAKAEGAGAVVTVATLTGAALIALGRVRVPIMGHADELIADLERASAACGERVWRLPFDEEYHRMLRSPNADVSNVGGREGGCITAGCFLSRFAGEIPFAHCDISPASWMMADHELGPQGATGVFVTTLSNLATG